MKSQLRPLLLVAAPFRPLCGIIEIREPRLAGAVSAGVFTQTHKRKDIMAASMTLPEIDSPADISRPGNDEIAALAFQLWKARGCPIGSPDEDWYLAEAELNNQQRTSSEGARPRPHVLG